MFELWWASIAGSGSHLSAGRPFCISTCSPDSSPQQAATFLHFYASPRFHPSKDCNSSTCLWFLPDPPLRRPLLFYISASLS